MLLCAQWGELRAAAPRRLCSSKIWCCYTHALCVAGQPKRTGGQRAYGPHWTNHVLPFLKYSNGNSHPHVKGTGAPVLHLLALILAQVNLGCSLICCLYTSPSLSRSSQHISRTTGSGSCERSGEPCSFLGLQTVPTLSWGHQDIPAILPGHPSLPAPRAFRSALHSSCHHIYHHQMWLRILPICQSASSDVDSTKAGVWSLVYCCIFPVTTRAWYTIRTQ